MSREAAQSAPNAVVVGMGRTGLSVARHLQRSGFRIAVTDTREAPPELASVQALGSSVVTRTGGFDARLLEGADIVVTSPGVPLDDPFFVQARARGLDIVGDIELFARAVDAPVVGITGTNGKSTVTTLLGRMAERAGVRVRVGGNLGQPALDLLGRGATDLYVLELSSFQLDTTHSLKLKASVVLNVSADHMDRYATLKAYAASKARIYANSETAVVNADEPEVVRMPRPGQRVLAFSLRDPKADFSLLTTSSDPGPWLARRGAPLLPLTALRIAGRHNAANALATLALGDALRLPMAPMLEELREFPGLPHRAQWVADINGVRYINDSKGTNVGATLAAVGGLAGPLVLIAGGDGKGQDFTPLAAAFRGKVRTTVLLGRDASLIETALAGICHTLRVGGMPEAVRAAARFAQPGDTVLLSPACSSLDMFRDYAERGNVFATAVKELGHSEPSGERENAR
ncbi:MAG TPA: UDP-N-acetylmuramoyl-L-alanine--D-glutamate ligase [Steroidobacteraceae bacterium]|jgi:UDP-N-acetylmuramoylalanine--D-glutamate ligase|nr:UDP-N-acetylmuramoyl-L-alanine--D-glutamate ligase [Steroidobacteraceae bacterium]